MSLPTPEPKMLADYRAELLDVGLPEHVADAVVVDAAAAVHRSSARPGTPPGVDDDWAPDELSRAILARRAERAAELESIEVAS